jgi:hypothetical protein
MKTMRTATNAKRNKNLSASLANEIFVKDFPEIEGLEDEEYVDFEIKLKDLQLLKSLLNQTCA